MIYIMEKSGDCDVRLVIDLKSASVFTKTFLTKSDLSWDTSSERQCEETHQLNPTARS